jgi:hypothetical protein
MEKLYESEAEEIVIFLTDYMGDFIKCNKNSHEEIRKLLDLIFKVCMEEFIKEESNNLLYIFQDQSISVTTEANNEKISIIESNLRDLNEIVSNTDDVVCKLQTSQKYLYTINKLYTTYIQKSLVDLTFVNVDNEIEKKINELSTFDKYKKVLFNGGEYKYKVYTPLNKKKDEDTDISIPKLDEETEDNENLIEKKIIIDKFSKNKGKFVIQKDLYDLLDRLINPLEDKEEEIEEEKEEEETSSNLIDVLQGSDMKEGGKRKTKINRKINKHNRTKKSKK